MIFPSGVSVLNDDFVYIRSVVQTLHHHQPWTDDWLEPWAASFSVISVLLFKITNSFYFSTYGHLSILGAISFWAVASLFRSRGCRTLSAIFYSGLILLFPTFLWKSLEFTGEALYVPCLFLALLAAEKQNWLGFAAVWLLAIASRQSAVAWGILPAFQMAHAIYQGGSNRWRTLWTGGAVLASGAVLFLTLKRIMNQDHAQRVVTQHTWERINEINYLPTAVVGVVVFLFALGLSNYLLYPGPGDAGKRFNFSTAAIVICITGILIWFARPFLYNVQLEHPLFSGIIGKSFLSMVMGLAVIGWMRGRFSFRIDYALAALGALVLVMTRETTWDYYYIDVAVFGLMGVMPRKVLAADSTRGPQLQAITLAPLLAAGAFSFVFFIHMKCSLDRGWALCVLAEQSLRIGKLSRADLSHAPFGFVGWHLYPYYIKHEGRDDPRLAGFMGYLIPGAVKVESAYSRFLQFFPQFKSTPPSDLTKLIASGDFPYLWFFKAKFFLLRARTEQDAPPEKALPQTSESFENFPLNDREWSDYISEHFR